MVHVPQARIPDCVSDTSTAKPLGRGWIQDGLAEVTQEGDHITLHVPSLAPGPGVVGDGKPKLGAHREDDHQYPQAVRLDTVQPEPVRWLWEGHIPVGKLTLWYGDPGVGKGYAFCSVAAALSTGTALPLAPARPAASVLIFEAEDGVADTLKARIASMGGDEKRIHVVEGPFPLSPSGLEHIRQQIEAYRPELVIFNPLVAYLASKVDLHRSNQVRAITAALAAMADRYRCAILLIHHTNKSETQRAALRASGTYDLMAVARSAHIFGLSSAQPSTGAMIQVKRNLTSARTAVGYEFDPSGAFRWTGESKLTPEDFNGSPGPGGQLLREATEFLQRILQNGPRLVEDVRKEAMAHGISWMTLRRAREDLGIQPAPVYYGGKKKGVSHWTWELPAPADLFDDHDSLSIK